MKTIQEAFNKLAFMAPVIVDLCDTLESSNVPQQQLKFHLKRLNLEAQKLLAKHYKLYESVESVTSKDNTNEIATEDIYNITSSSYDWILNKSPHEICVIVELVKRMEVDGLDYSDVSVNYKPILK